MAEKSKTTSSDGAETRKDFELSTIQPPNTLRLKAPQTDDYVKWMNVEIPNYITATKYLAFFFEARRQMGDMTEEEIWDEIKANVSMHARVGCDILGVQ